MPGGGGIGRPDAERNGPPGGGGIGLPDGLSIGAFAGRRGLAGCGCRPEPGTRSLPGGWSSGPLPERALRRGGGAGATVAARRRDRGRDRGAPRGQRRRWATGGRGRRGGPGPAGPAEAGRGSRRRGASLAAAAAAGGARRGGSTRTFGGGPVDPRPARLGRRRRGLRSRLGRGWVSAPSPSAGAAGSSGCTGRMRPSRSALRRTRSAWASSIDEEWLFTPIPSEIERSSASLFVSPSSFASS